MGNIDKKHTEKEEFIFTALTENEVNCLKENVHRDYDLMVELAQM